MSDQVDKLMQQIEQLRDALKGRTMSCELCNETARQRDEMAHKQDVLNVQMASTSTALLHHVRHRQHLLDAVRQFVRAERQYGQSRGHRWMKAWDNLCELVPDE